MANERPAISLTRTSYTVREVAFLLHVKPRTVREYMLRDSEKRPGQKLLVATKPKTLWMISKEDFINFLKEKYHNE